MREALRAAAAEKSGIAKLSGERIAKEMLRLLEAENPAPVLRLMAASGILAEVLPGEANVARLESLAKIDAANSFAPDALLRLAALLPHDAKIADGRSLTAGSFPTRRANGWPTSPARTRRSCPIFPSARPASCSTGWACGRSRIACS